MKTGFPKAMKVILAVLVAIMLGELVFLLVNGTEKESAPLEPEAQVEQIVEVCESAE